jgi:hypothetical protein
MAISRGMNSTGLGLVVPSILSLVADCTDDATCRSGFGWLLQLSSNLSHVGALNCFLAVEPHFPTRHGHTDGARGEEDMAEMVREAKFVVRIPTSQIFVAQGVSDSFLPFASMWLELIGFSHDDTAVLMAIF